MTAPSLPISHLERRVRAPGARLEFQSGFETSWLGAGFKNVANFREKLFFPGRLGRGGGHYRHWFSLQRVHGFYDREDAEGHDEEVDDCVDELPIGDYC